MALYLGSEKLKINLDGILCHLNIYSKKSITNSIRLLSSDRYILKGSNGLYLIPKVYIDLVDDVLSSLDDYILQDSNGLDLIPNDYY